MNDAKRQVEQGKDVVMLLNSLTRLARAHNLNSDMWAGPRNHAAEVTSFRWRRWRVHWKLGGACLARHVLSRKAGSLTIVASCLVETGSRLDEVVYEEFKGTGNLEIRLSRELADRRIFPAVDIAASSSRQEERLLSPEELRAMANFTP